MKLKAIGIGSLLTVFLFISGFLVILTPLPLVYVSATSGRKNGFYSAALSFFIVIVLYVAVFSLAKTPLGTQALSVPLPGLGLVSHFSLPAIEIFGGGYFLFFLSIALVLGEAVRQHWGLIKGGGRALIAGLVLTIAVAGILHFAGVNNVIVSVRNYIEYIVTEVVNIQQAAGVSNEQTMILAERGPEIAQFIYRIIPSLIFVFALVSVVFNILLSRRFIRLPHLFHGHSWDVAAFRIPDAVIWAVIGAILMFFAGHYLSENIVLKYFGINLMIVLGAVYFFQGLAVMAFFIRRIRFPLFRLFVYLLIILFFQTVGLLIIGLGFTDVWVNFRHRAHRKMNSA